MNAVTIKFGLAVVLGAVLSAPALAQQPDWSQRGGRYVLGKTIVQPPAARQTKKFDQGDYYAPRQTRKFEQGGYYPSDAPFGGENHCCVSTSD